MPPDTDPYFTPDPSPRGRLRPNYDPIIEKHSADNQIDPNLMRAMMNQESGGSRLAISPKGARGLMQLMPATAQRFGTSDVNDPDQNIRGGARYLKFLSDRFKGDTDKILAGYNAGEGAVDKFGGIPPYKETQDYVRSVKAKYQKLGGGQLPQQPASDPYFTPDTAPQAQPKPRPKSPFAGVRAGASGIKPTGVEVGGSVGQPSAAAQGKGFIRGMAEMAGSPTQLLPADAQDYVNEIAAKGAAGLMRTGSGVVKTATRFPTLGAPNIAEKYTQPLRQGLNKGADMLSAATQAEDAAANRGVISQTAQDVAGGGISSAPAMVLTGLGVPAPVAFGLQSYLESTGRDADWKDVLKETGIGAATGALFEIPLPARLGILAKIGAKLGIVGGGTYGIEKLAGVPESEARKNAAVNALFAASGAGPRRGPTPRGGEAPIIPERNVSEDVGVGIRPESGDIMAANAKIAALQRRIQEAAQVKQSSPRMAALKARLDSQLADAIDARNGLLDPKVQARLEGRSLAEVLDERRALREGIPAEAPQPEPSAFPPQGEDVQTPPQSVKPSEGIDSPKRILERARLQREGTTQRESRQAQVNPSEQPITPVPQSADNLPSVLPREAAQPVMASTASPPADVTGIAHRVETATRGSEPARGESIGAEESVQRGRDLLTKSDDPGRLVAKTVTAFDRTGAVSPESMAVVRAQHEQLAQEANRAFDANGLNSPEFTAAEQARRDFYDNAVKPMQTAWSNTGRAQQGETAMDTGTFYGLYRAFRDTTGREMNPREQLKAGKLAQTSAEADLRLSNTQKRLVDTLNSICPP